MNLKGKNLFIIVTGESILILKNLIGFGITFNKECFWQC